MVRDIVAAGHENADYAHLRNFAALDVVGADVVEASPAYDHAEITAVAAANLSWKLLSLYARRAP